MTNKTFAEKAVTFFNHLDLTLPPSLQIGVLNPYKNPELRDCTEKFFNKFFNDHRKRIFIMGINPGRFGGGLTGISFTDPVALRKFCGIENNFGNKRELSSEFIYMMIEEYGGVKKFYRDFFMSAVCPLGFKKGSLNYNYYDDTNLLKAVTPFIRNTWNLQIEMGAREDALIVIGTNKNRKFIESLNNEFQFFEKIIPLEHPRFIMQYRRKKLDHYIAQYVSVLHEFTRKKPG